MRETTGVRRTPRLRPVRPAGWWFDGLLLAALVGLTVALASGHLLGLDRAVADWADAHRPAAAYWVARLLNFLGQGTPLTLLAAGVGVVVGVRLRSVRPILPPVVAFLLTNLTIGPLKLWTDRAAPSASVKPPYLPEADTVRLFHTDGVYGMSYPSGHVANAIVWYGVLALLLPALLRTVRRTVPARLVTVVRVLPPLIVLATTTYLGWHWLTDSVAGLLLGLLLDRLLHRVPWDDLPLPGPLRHRDAPFTSVP
ncbi:phosphatase PAP2 family protein [Micromonospora terminaliae]|uniref:Phosphatase PAP2 family protein n=1 Tax=Micromonospora terminaliae TaxID=1914461 RepID=A0AAJ3DMK0_9ACTN|nr:phosphatase PAP2 family protein [Micromonospora terminaliae]NES31443.1 phosphatase PAP2 family protein [Micromonospora terminaliae]QGL49743.1 phosphatase PAP2 family protein [Micromonospora terminaliae]